jgi:cytochrome bd ubiquinol oxidase subunit II
MPALYAPVTLMLIGLIFRGVAFEFRHNAKGRRQSLWSISFSVGSYVATIAQGLVLGGFIQGVTVEGRAFAGGPFDWLTPFSLLVALGLVVGYALLGAAWLVYKTEGPLHDRAKRWTQTLALGVGVALGAVSFATLYVDPQVTARWGFADGSLDWADAQLALLPLAAGGLLAAIYARAAHSHSFGPYLMSIGVFACGFLGLAISLWPYMVPFELTPQEAAAPDNALQFMLVGAVVLLPMILAYTAYSYWVFRAKVAPDASYH